MPFPANGRRLQMIQPDGDLVRQGVAGIGRAGGDQMLQIDFEGQILQGGEDLAFEGLFRFGTVEEDTGDAGEASSYW